MNIKYKTKQYLNCIFNKGNTPIFVCLVLILIHTVCIYIILFNHIYKTPAIILVITSFCGLIYLLGEDV
jgi:hypothetical protein